MAKISNQEFISRYGAWAVVAGASEGIGLAYAREIAKRGLNVMLVARREGPLMEAAEALRHEFGVEALAVSADLGSENVMDVLAPRFAGIDIGLAVYNACYSDIGPFLEQTAQGKLSTIYVNCRGPMLFSSYFADYFSKRGRGGLILMSSMAGFQGSSMVVSYAATKAFNTVLGEGLWAELTPRSVDVLVCAAGATLTPAFRRQTPEARQKGAFPLTPEAVAREGLAHLGKGPTHICGFVNRLAHFLTLFMPRKQAVRFMASNTERLYSRK
jgi:short-subunit dehydrogenase